jgi:hypothetical protein
VSLASVKEIAAIHEIVEPWLRITSYKQARNSGGLYPEGPYSFEADINVTEEVARNTPWDGSHRAARAYLLGRAEDAMEALEAAGWHLDGAVAITVRTPHNRLQGRPSEPGKIAVTVSFAVDKDRSEEEMAMDPAWMAAKLLTGWTP